MARYTGPKCKLCRREGMKLFLKGSRCLTEKCAVTRRNQVPGENFRSARRLSDYGKQLREKQKVKRMYGVLEAQFRRYFENAAKVRGVTGLVLLQILETRLDNVCVRIGLAPSHAAARKLVGAKKVKVNGNVIDIPSFQVKPGDMVTVEGVATKPKEDSDVPGWLGWHSDKNAAEVLRLPVREDINLEVNEQLIVEYYSR